MSDESDFIPKIIHIMNTAEKLSRLSEKEKKRLRCEYNNHGFTKRIVQYAPVLSLIIDGLCKVKKEDIKMMFNKVSYCCR